MTRYFLKRLLHLLIVIFGVMILTFAIGRMIPGDPARVVLGERATAEMVQNMRVKLGLDQPLTVQFFRYFIRVIQGDLGNSITQFVPVKTIIRSSFPATVELMIMSVLWSVVIGIPVGILAAAKKNSLFDYTSMTIALFGVSMPVFWIGILFIMFFSVRLGWLPASGRNESLFHGLAVLFSQGQTAVLRDALSTLFMPSLALGSMFIALVARMTRSSMLEVLNEQYIETARAKGLKRRVVVNRHAARNAMIPVVTVIGMQIGALMGGAVLTETVFAWPGIGRVLIEAIYARDYPLFQGIILFSATIFAVVNLAVDLLYALLDPRINYE